MNSKLTSWLSEQKPWQREAARRLLDDGIPNDDALKEIVKILQNPETAPAIPPKAAEAAPETTKLRLRELGPVSGFDRLRTRKPLVLAPDKLSVVYGANGSGKTGYVRILKHLADKPRKNPLRPNVFQDTEESGTCRVVYEVAGKEISHDWVEADGAISHLTNIDVFDSQSGTFYVSDELEVNYAPPELALLTGLAETYKKIQGLLVAERDSVSSALPIIPKEFEETKTALLYKAPAKNEATLTAWDEEKSAELAKLRSQLGVSDPANELKRLEEKKKQAEAIALSLKGAVSAVDAERVIEIRGQVKTLAKDRAAVAEAALALSSVVVLDGISTDTWRVMWEAARKYSEEEAYRGIKFPNVSKNARCPLCQQPLIPSGTRRFAAFETFIHNELSTKVTASSSVLDQSIKQLPKKPATETLSTSMIAADIDSVLQEQIAELWVKIEALASAISKLPIDDDLYELAAKISPQDLWPISKIGEYVSGLESQISLLSLQQSPEERQQLSIRLVELRALEWTSQQAEALRIEIERQRRVSRYEAWISETNTAPVSRKAGELADELITEAFLERFQTELVQLGAKHIRVELKKTANTAGRPKYRLNLQGLTRSAKPGEILSEGESRIVALAAFLADVTGKQANSPFVFDDPISSLDQTFEEKAAARLCELSKTRQVVVFTHRLSFASLLSQGSGASDDFIGLKAEPWGTGNPGSVPLFAKRPKEALERLKREDLARARKVLNDTGSDDYGPLGKALCSEFRILLERSIEQELLGGVVLRFRRGIQTLNMVTRLASIERKDCELLDELMTKYSVYEHSQPAEAPVEPLQPDELDSDFDRLLQWFDEFGKRKKSA